MSSPTDRTHDATRAPLRQSIQDTLASDPDASLAGSPSMPHSDRSRTELTPGTKVGRYVVLQRVGSGAMGVVYAAFDAELDRRVAIKLVHAERQDGTSGGSERSGGAVRLLREAQAIAKLRHPNVIVVHDVGTFEDQVFIAMEYVDGPTLRRWLDDTKPSWSEVLPRFRAAALGLAAAHEAGIVHRDFKPENVLLGSDGRVCVADFGLARAVTSELDTTTNVARNDSEVLTLGLTQTGAVIGTPAYMAPEQHVGTATDARTDQFSFCVALYEALFRQRPFEGDSLAVLAYHVIQGEVRPPPDGTGVPRWLASAVLRGLAVDPAARHASMAALLDVLARDPSAARRRRVRLAAVALGLAGLGGAAWFAFAGAPVCEGAAEHFAAVWGATQRSTVAAAIEHSGAPTAKDVADRVVTGLDAYAAAWVDMHTDACEATRVRGEQSSELLDRRMSCLDNRKRHAHTVIALLSESDPALVDHAVDIVAGLQPIAGCGDAERLLAALPPPPADNRERVQAAQATIDEVKTLRTAARIADARTRIDGIADEVAALDYRPLTARALYYRSAVALDEGDAASAEKLAYDATAACAVANDLALEAQSWTALVRIVGITGRRYDELQPLTKAAEAAIARLGDDAPFYQAQLDASVGTIEVLRGNASTAEARLRNAQRLFTELRGPDDRATLETEEMLALTLYNQERYDESEALYRQVIAAHDRISGPEHPIGATALANLGLVYAARGRDVEALDAYERAHVRLLAAWGPKHPIIPTSLMNISNTMRRLGRFDEAEARLREAIALDVELFGPDDMRVAQGDHQLGQLAMARKQPALALDSYRTAVAKMEKAAGPTDAALGYPLTGMGEALLELGRPAEAIAPLERALAVRLGAESVPSDERASTQFALARAIRASGGDGAHARALATEARAALDPGEHAEHLAAIDAWLAAAPSGAI